MAEGDRVWDGGAPTGCLLAGENEKGEEELDHSMGRWLKGWSGSAQQRWGDGLDAR